METMLIVGNHVSQQPNDKQEVEPALAQLDQLPENLGKVEKAALDSGFFSARQLLRGQRARTLYRRRSAYT